jgi:hypothetical protein
MSTPEDAAGEAVVCPSCQKNLQVPPNAPPLPKHLEPGGMGVGSPQAVAAAAAGSPYGRVGAAVAAPPAPGAGPMFPQAPAQAGRAAPMALFLIGGLALVVVGAIIVFLVAQGNKRAVVKAKKSDSPTARIDDDPTPIDSGDPDHLDAIRLYQIYWDNQLAADNAYKDREITLTGVIDSVGKNDTDLFVNLSGSKHRELTKRIKCYFPPSQKSQLANLVSGKKIKIKGVCEGKVEGVIILRKCQCFEP